uniref:Putative secreted protein n=1 Tax=Ixodes ricinus TaxID=34613 RepID=A0A147BCU2_IXORI
MLRKLVPVWRWLLPSCLSTLLFAPRVCSLGAQVMVWVVVSGADVMECRHNRSLHLFKAGGIVLHCKRVVVR